MHIDNDVTHRLAGPEVARQLLIGQAVEIGVKTTEVAVASPADVAATLPARYARLLHAVTVAVTLRPQIRTQTNVLDTSHRLVAHVAFHAFATSTSAL